MSKSDCLLSVIGSVNLHVILFQAETNSFNNMLLIINYKYLFCHSMTPFVQNSPGQHSSLPAKPRNRKFLLSYIVNEQNVCILFVYPRRTNAAYAAYFLCSSVRINYSQRTYSVRLP